MRIALLAAVAASALISSPALAAPGNGNAYGNNKVCLVTFGTPAERAGQADADVVDARYLPLPAAMNQEAKSDDVSDIYTYGDDGYTGPGVDYHYDGASTEETCAYLDDLGDSDED